MAYDTAKRMVMYERVVSSVRSIPLVRTFRTCMSYVPSLWGEVRVVFVPKVGRSDYSDPKAFRPISLSFFSGRHNLHRGGAGTHSWQNMEADKLASLKTKEPL